MTAINTNADAGVILDAMSKEERSLLLYLETCAVDRGGMVDTARMNAADHRMARHWAASGFLRFSRLRSDLIAPASRPEARRVSHAVKLVDLSWRCAAMERRRRAERSVNADAVASLEHFEGQRQQPTKGRGGKVLVTR